MRGEAVVKRYAPLSHQEEMKGPARAKMKFFKKIFFYLALFEILFLIPAALGYAKNVGSTAEKVPLPSLSLIGVIVSKDASSSVAVLRNERDGRTVMLKKGESILGLTLVQVLENRAVFEKAGERFQIFLGRGNLASVEPRLPEKPVEVPRRDDYAEGSEIKADSNIDKREFVRAELQKRVEEEWPLIMKDTKFVPNMVEGKVSGFKITSMPERSILSEVGIQRNDVIKEVNGIELRDMETLFTLYEKFKDENRFEVSIERNGKLHRVLYILK